MFGTPVMTRFGHACALALALSAFPLMALAASFDGRWEDRNTCEDYQGGGMECDPKDKLHQPDYMQLELITKNNLVCGRIESTAYLMRKIDSTLVVGTIEGNVAYLQFGGSHLERPVSRSTAGQAKLVVNGNKANWQIVREANSAEEGAGGASYTWLSAQLTRKPWKAIRCDASGSQSGQKSPVKADSKTKKVRYFCHEGERIRREIEARCQSVWPLIETGKEIDFTE